MVTLHVLQYLKNEGFGTALDTDLFWEKLPAGKVGIGIFSLGGERPYGGRSMSQLFDLECRGKSDLLGMRTLEKVARHFQDTLTACELPAVPATSNLRYVNCRFVSIGNIENMGMDSNDRVIFKLTARVIYQQVNKET